MAKKYKKRKIITPELIEQSILPKLPHRFTYLDVFQKLFNYKPKTIDFDKTTKSKYMKVFFPINKLAKRGILKKQKIGKKIFFTKQEIW